MRIEVTPTIHDSHETTESAAKTKQYLEFGSASCEFGADLCNPFERLRLTLLNAGMSRESVDEWAEEFKSPDQN